MKSVTFPVICNLNGETVVKHTYGNVRKLVKDVLKLSELTPGSQQFIRQLNKLYTTVDTLDKAFEPYRKMDTNHKPRTRAIKLAQYPNDLAGQYQRELSEHTKEVEMLRILIRGVDLPSCTPLERAQVDLLRYAIQDDGFYMPEAKATIERLLRS